MNAIFITEEYVKAATRLGEAQRSLHLLVSSPDYLDRKNLLVKLLNRLEAALSPLLVAALNEYDSENVRTIYTCFETVGKSGDFFSFYYRAKKGQVIKDWESIDVSVVL
jgi:SNF2 family DNA or RNA helicase